MRDYTPDQNEAKNLISLAWGRVSKHNINLTHLRQWHKIVHGRLTIKLASRGYPIKRVYIDQIVFNGPSSDHNAYLPNKIYFHHGSKKYKVFASKKDRVDDLMVEMALLI